MLSRSLATSLRPRAWPCAGPAFTLAMNSDPIHRLSKLSDRSKKEERKPKWRILTIHSNEFSWPQLKPDTAASTTLFTLFLCRFLLKALARLYKYFQVSQEFKFDHIYGRSVRTEKQEPQTLTSDINKLISSRRRMRGLHQNLENTMVSHTVIL